MQVLYIFRIIHKETQHHLALVVPFDRPRLVANRDRDRELQLTRVLARPRRESVFIDTNAIIRGALLAEDRSS